VEVDHSAKIWAVSCADRILHHVLLKWVGGGNKSSTYTEHKAEKVKKADNKNHRKFSIPTQPFTVAQSLVEHLLAEVGHKSWQT
jgi:hypothetical protein